MYRISSNLPFGTKTSHKYQIKAKITFLKMATQTVCNFNKYGFCKFRLTCRRQHVTELCDNSSCDILKCNKRHPKECRYYRDYNRCIFGEWCFFKHIEKDNDLETLKQENEALKKKIDEIDKLLSEKDNMIDSIVNSMLEKFKKIEERLYSLECEETQGETTFFNPSCSAEKPFLDITDNIIEIENNDEPNESTCEIETDEKETKDEETSKTSPVVYKCDICDFETTHHPGLKSHMTKMHNQKITHKCEQCSETFETRKKLKNHVYCIHSGKYKTLAELCAEANP